MLQYRVLQYRKIAVLCSLLALLAGCDSPIKVAAVEFRIPVEVIDVTTALIEDLIVTTGTLRARESILLTVETPGFLMLAKDENGERLAEGSKVKANQIIAEITGEDARLASRMGATERHLQSAKVDLERRQQLYKQKLISEEDVWRARTQYEDRLHDYETSQRTYEKTRIITPIAGVILELARASNGQAVADGQMVSQGFGVAQVAALNVLIADIDLVGPDLSRVSPGQKVRINHYAFEDKTIDGTILRLSPSMNAQTHTFRVEVEVDNEQGLLRPGMFIRASIVTERHENVVAVPRDAITQRSGRKVVFVIDGQRVVQRKVALGLSDDDKFEISEGLRSGERIVIRGLETLTDGTRVRVIAP